MDTSTDLLKHKIFITLMVISTKFLDLNQNHKKCIMDTVLLKRQEFIEQTLNNIMDLLKNNGIVLILFVLKEYIKDMELVLHKLKMTVILMVISTKFLDLNQNHKKCIMDMELVLHKLKMISIMMEIFTKDLDLNQNHKRKLV